MTNPYGSNIQPPTPGTYYDNQAGQFQGYRTRTRGSSLMAFMILEWISFGFGILGLFGGLIGLIDPVSAIALLLISLLMQVVSVVLSFFSALGISQYKKWGVKLGWISVAYSWFALFFGTVISYLSMQDAKESILNDPAFASENVSGDFGSFLETATTVGIIVSVFFGLIWVGAKTILLSTKSAREHKEMFFN